MDESSEKRVNPVPILWFAVYPAILAAYLGVRLLGIGDLVTTDEPFWLGRSANFYRALVTHDWVNTYQMAHPGVMTMWAGAIAYAIEFPQYATLAQGNMTVPYAIEHHLREMGADPLAMMIAAKTAKILMQSLFFTLALIILPKLMDHRTAITAGILIAFSPMLSGHDSALHVDGLFSIICLAALLLVCYAGFHELEQKS